MSPHTGSPPQSPPVSDSLTTGTGTWQEPPVPWLVHSGSRTEGKQERVSQKNLHRGEQILLGSQNCLAWNGQWEISARKSWHTGGYLRTCLLGIWESSPHHSKERHCTPRAIWDPSQLLLLVCHWARGSPVTPHNPQSTPALAGTGTDSQARRVLQCSQCTGLTGKPPEGSAPVCSPRRGALPGPAVWGTGSGCSCGVSSKHRGVFSVCGFRVWDAQGEQVQDGRKCMWEGSFGGQDAGFGGQDAG